MKYNPEDSWERPITTRRYLHPPFAEELATMWIQMAFFIGEVYEKNLVDTPSAACQFLIGKDYKIPDFKIAKHKTREDGAPIHGLVYDFDEYTVLAESFCNQHVRPTMYTKFTITNKVRWKVEDSFGFLMRSAREEMITGIFDLDGYCTHNPNIRAWGDVPRKWNAETNHHLTDGTYHLYFKDIEDLNPRWDGEVDGLSWHERGRHTFSFALDAGESKTFYMAFGKEATENFDFESEKEKSIAFWNKELDRIKVYPNGQNPVYRTMLRHLVSQLLQMFSYHVGKNDFVLLRQGGLQRKMWPGEANEFLMALDRIGDFDDYTEKGYEMFFKKLQVMEGEDRGQIMTLDGSIPWAKNTAKVVLAMAYKFIVKEDDKYYKKYREHLYAAFQWIEKVRRSTKDSDFPGKGLFPPMRSCDWEFVSQNWGGTDLSIILMYLKLLKAFEKYNDPAVPEIKDAIEDYKACITRYWKEEVDEQGDSPELIFYGVLGAEKNDPLTELPCVNVVPNLINSGIFPHDSDYAKRYYKAFENRNLIQNGLHSVLTANQFYNMNWVGHVWYTSTGDAAWFEHYMALGDREKAEKTLTAQLKYSMTDEYYMLERYAANDKYYIPWSPNASANGRTIMMLCDFYGV